MPGIKFHSNPRNGGLPVVQEYLVANSQTIRSGDVIVLVSSTTVNIVARAGADADALTNSWTETSIKGILGIAMTDAKSDSAGVATGTVAPGGSGAPSNYPTYQLGNYSQSLAPDSATGRGKVLVALANATNLFRSTVVSSLAAVTVTRGQFVGQRYGLQYNRTGFTNKWQIDQNAVGNNLCLLIEDVDEAQATYNASSTQTEVVFRFLQTHCQSDIGLFYTA